MMDMKKLVVGVAAIAAIGAVYMGVCHFMCERKAKMHNVKIQELRSSACVSGACPEPN